MNGMVVELYFILDLGFDGDLWALSRSAHVWIVRSPRNEAAARAVWERDADTRSSPSGVTVFDGSIDATATFYASLGTIALHHDEFSSPEPWSTIHVVGLPIDRVRPERVAKALSVDAVRLAPEAGGFAITCAARRGEGPDGASRRKRSR